MAFSEDVLNKVKELTLDQLKDHLGITHWSASASVGHLGEKSIDVTITLLLPKGSATVILNFDMDQWDDIMKEKT